MFYNNHISARVANRFAAARDMSLPPVTPLDYVSMRLSRDKNIFRKYANCDDLKFRVAHHHIITSLSRPLHQVSIEASEIYSTEGMRCETPH